jgi:hypothetical protein
MALMEAKLRSVRRLHQGGYSHTGCFELSLISARKLSGSAGKIINAHHALPIARVWSQGTSSSSDGQFFHRARIAVCDSDTSLLDQPHRVKLEIARKLPSCHAGPPAR